MAMRFSYFLKEGFNSAIRNGLMTIASVLTASSCLIILGFFMLIGLNTNYISTQIKDNCDIKIAIKKDIPKDRVAAIGEQIKADANVKATIFVSSEEALKEAQKIFGENKVALEGLEVENPLGDYYKVTLVNPSVIKQTADIIAGFDGVDKVIHNEETISKIINFTDILRKITFWIVLILAVIAVFIISNTIKITVMARRKEIKIMKLIGATNWFIRWPFIIEGIIIGIIGAVLAVLVVLFGYEFALNAITTANVDIFRLLPLNNVYFAICTSILVIGFFIGALGSGVAARKYLKV